MRGREDFVNLTDRFFCGLHALAAVAGAAEIAIAAM